MITIALPTKVDKDGNVITGGWNLLPGEPTVDMLIAGMEVSVRGMPSADDSDYVRGIYQAMLAAYRSTEPPPHRP